MKAYRITGITLISALGLAVFPGQALSQQRFGNETVFEHTPSVEELNALFRSPGKSEGKASGLPKGTRSIVLTGPIVPPGAPNGGAATITQVPQSGGGRPAGNTVSILIQFDLNSAVIKPQYEASLANLATSMQANPNTTMEIGGHADATGDVRHNLDLSNRRAQSVRDYLIGVHGIAPSRLTARGYGQSLPLSGLAGTDGRNRRVSFTAQGG